MNIIYKITDFFENLYYNLKENILITIISVSLIISFIIFLIIFSLSGFSYDESGKRILKKDLYKITYLEELKKLKKKFGTDENIIDKTLNYGPGIVRKVKINEVKTDEKSGIKIVEGELIVELLPGFSDKDLLHILKKNKIESSIIGCIPTFNFYQVKVNDFNDSTIKLIKDNKIVKNVTYQHIHETMENYNYDKEKITIDDKFWHLKNYNIPQIWMDLTSDNSAVIAFIDSGIDISLPAFENKIINPYSVITNSEKFEDGVYQKNYDKLRVISHGTKVAGLAAGYIKKNNLFIGVAPDAKVMPIQVLGFCIYNEQILTNDMMIIEGIARAIAYKADIINISLGTDYSKILPADRTNETLLAEAYKKMDAYVTNILSLFDKPFYECEIRNIPVICSAGNDNIPAKYQPLSAHKYTISIGAIDKDNLVADFSNNGETVDCYAPGVDVLTIAPGGSFFKVSGTSFSAPYVAGIFALAKSNGLFDIYHQYNKIIKDTNFEAKTSIFPEVSVQIFYPIGFLNELGANITINNEELEFQFRFYKKYKEFFINKSDNEKEILNKIIGYYTKRNFFNKNELEAKYAIERGGKYFNELFNIIINNDQKEYFASLILANSNLTNEQLEYVNANLEKNDIAAIITNYHNYSKSLSKLLERLEKQPGRFNGNSLFGIDKFADIETKNKVIKNYLEYLQQKSAAIRNDECIACYILSKNNLSNNEEIKSFILKSYNRFNSSKNDFNKYSNISTTYYLSYALILSGDKKGLEIAINALGIMDSQNNKFDKNESDFKKFQGLLNTNTRFGFSYNYEDPQDKRKEILINFKKKIETAIFEDGIYKSN